MSSGLARLLGILLVNVLPLAGVLWFGWSVFEVLFLYWFENVAVGLTQVVRIVICMRTTKAKDGNPVFFLLHYGLFTFVHGTFVVSLFAPEGDAWGLGPDFLAPVAAIMGWQVAALVLDAIRTEGFKDRTPTGLLFEPYPRVLALHFTVIAGGFLVMLMGSPVWALAILVVLKTLSDLAIAAVLSVGTAGFPHALRKKRD